MVRDDTIDACFLLRYPGSRDDEFVLDVDVAIPGRGVTAFFGPSGSGKTTLLRCVAGLEHPQRGYFALHDEVWQSDELFRPAHKRPVGYVFQEASLFPHLTGRGNLDFALKRSGSAGGRALYEQVVDSMDIASLLSRLPSQLSGGERQRVAIARALLVQPRLLLMDEPLASLDQRRKREILPYLERLRSTFQIPVFYVSHSTDEVARLADHVVVLEEGRVTAEGPLTEVYARMDLPMGLDDETGVVLEGQVAERDAGWHLAKIRLEGGGAIWIRDGGDRPGQTVRVQVLARDVSLSMAPHEDTSILNRLSVEVTDVAADPDEAMALVRLRSGDDVLIARITRRSADHLQLEPGKALWAQLKSAAIVR
jgi:molybdate transport system ATP-binding protein